jgi:hypothetical protein
LYSQSRTRGQRNLEYATAIGSIQCALEKPLPLIRKITAFRVRESIEKDKKWRT